MLRNKFCLRVPTTVCQKPPSDYSRFVAKFVAFVSKMRQKNNYGQIYACDETAVWLDASGGKTVEEHGANNVSIS